jgi:hypothetical protein
MPLLATEPETRLAPVAKRYRKTRHACGRANGGDDQPTILTFEGFQDRQISRTPTQSAICSGIVDVNPN